MNEERLVRLIGNLDDFDTASYLVPTLTSDQTKLLFQHVLRDGRRNIVEYYLSFPFGMQLLRNEINKAITSYQSGDITKFQRRITRVLALGAKYLPELINSDNKPFFLIFLTLIINQGEVNIFDLIMQTGLQWSLDDIPDANLVNLSRMIIGSDHLESYDTAWVMDKVLPADVPVLINELYLSNQLDMLKDIIGNYLTADDLRYIITGLIEQHDEELLAVVIVLSYNDRDIRDIAEEAIPEIPSFVLLQQILRLNQPHMLKDLSFLFDRDDLREAVISGWRNLLILDVAYILNEFPLILEPDLDRDLIKEIAESNFLNLILTIAPSSTGLFLNFVPEDRKDEVQQIYDQLGSNGA